MKSVQHIVIVGGGFAGINLINHLDSSLPYEITLVDRNNYNFFPPLLYQVATGFLEPSNISFPFRKMFQEKKNVRFRMGELLEIFPTEKKILLSTGELHYDYLVLATGTMTNFFGNDRVREKALPMKTINDALEMRNYLLMLAEAAASVTDAEERKKFSNIVVAGGGPTGVEISGMLAEMKKSILVKDYPELNAENIHIYLIDMSPAVLMPMSRKAQENTYKTLINLGVIIKLKVGVKDYQDEQVILTDGETIQSKTLIWTAGVTAQRFKGVPETSYNKRNRLMVNEFNMVEGMNAIYAIGDTCVQSGDPAFPEGHPQLAQVAIQQGTRLAKNFARMEGNKPLQSFRYKDKGSMAIIRRNKAVADLPGKVFFKGFFAWLIWLFVHLFSLISYRNRVKTLYNWGTSYFTRDQSLRMIIRPGKARS